MGLKEIYEFLETSEDGKKLLETSKTELETLKGAEAKSRKIEKDYQKASAQLAELAELRKKIEDAGIDLDDPEPDADSAPPEKRPGRSKADREAEKLRKQINALTERVEAETKAREQIELRARTEKLRNDFGAALREPMGKYGELLAENLIGKGMVKTDDSGAVIYETGDKIYSVAEAVELLKTEHKDFLVPKQAGSNLPPPGRSSAPTVNQNLGGKTADEIGKTSSQQWLRMGLTAQTA